MIRHALMALAMAAGISAHAASLSSPPPDVAPGVAVADRYPAHAAAFPNGVRGIPNAVYWEPAGYRPLTLDLYLPPASVKQPPGGFPLIIYIHGGGWMGGDLRRGEPFADFPAVLASLSARGYVVASIEYRLSGEARFPAQAQDVKAAIRWLRLNAKKYGIDPARAVTWGVSAGGHLAALAAVSCNVSAFDPVTPAGSAVPDARPDPIVSNAVSDCVQAGVAWYGVFDMATIADQARRAGAMSRETAESPEWRLLGCVAKRCRHGEVRAASPVEYVDASDPPMLLIVGSADTAVPYTQTLEMAAKLNSAGVKNELIVLPGVGHGFTGANPLQTREANLAALDATFRFIDKTVGKPIVKAAGKTASKAKQRKMAARKKARRVRRQACP